MHHFLIYTVLMCLQNWHIVSIFINVQSSSITTSFSTIQTFDFQNNWQLSWTLTYNSSSTIAWYTSWQWFYTRATSSSYSVETRLTPPNSIYNNETLKRIRLWFYKPSIKWWFWPAWSWWTYWALTYQWNLDVTNADKIIKWNWAYNWASLTWNYILSQVYNWDLLFDINILSNWVSWTLWWESFVINDSNIANALRQLRTSKVFRIFNANRWNTTNAYIRKIEITTK